MFMADGTPAFADLTAVPDLPDDEAILREIAAMDLGLARRFYADAMAEPNAVAAAEITRAYNRATRSLRQCLALRAKLVHDQVEHLARHTPGGFRLQPQEGQPLDVFRQHQMARQAAKDPATDMTIIRRRLQLGQAIKAMIWNERETERLSRPKADTLRDRFDDEIRASLRDPDFANLPLGPHIRGVCARYGLTYNPAWEELDEPPIFWLYPRPQPADPPTGDWDTG